MDQTHIIQMANQIADAFAPYTDDEAIPAIAAHIRDFWEPRMLQALAACITAGARELHPRALAAAKAVFETS